MKNVTVTINPTEIRSLSYTNNFTMKPGEKIDKLLENGYSTVSLGYIGLAEATYALIGESNTSKKGSELSMKIIKKLRMKNCLHLIKFLV